MVSPSRVLRESLVHDCLPSSWNSADGPQRSSHLRDIAFLPPSLQGVPWMHLNLNFPLFLSTPVVLGEDHPNRPF